MKLAGHEIDRYAKTDAPHWYDVTLTIKIEDDDGGTELVKMHDKIVSERGPDRSAITRETFEDLLEAHGVDEDEIHEIHEILVEEETLIFQFA